MGKNRGDNMAGEENLIPLNKRTKEEQREITTAGGLASGESRRKRKAMREQAELLLSLPLQEGKLKEQLKALGVDADNIDNQMAMIISMWRTATVGGQNSVMAFNSLRDLMGEKPKEVIEIHSTDETIKELDKIIGEKKGE